MFLEISQNSQGNTCARVFFNKVASLRPATLLKKRLWHRGVPVKFAKFLRTLILTEHLWWLLLNKYFYEIKVKLFISENLGQIGLASYSITCSNLDCRILWNKPILKFWENSGLANQSLKSYSNPRKNKGFQFVKSNKIKRRVLSTLLQ